MKHLFTLLFASITINAAFAQTCAKCGPSTYPYMAKIAIDNTANSDTLTDYQVSFYYDTQTPISQDKMDSTGAGILLTSSCTDTLAFWIEGPMNDDSTKFWVRMPMILGSSVDTIYLLYGDTNAPNLSDVNATFINVVDSLRGSWHFDENAGTMAYETANGIHGEFNGNIAWSTNSARGASAMHSPTGGPDDRVQLGNFGDMTRLDHATEYTFMTWYNAQPNGSGLLLGFGDCCSPRNGYTMNMTTSQQIRFWGGSDSDNSNYNTYSANTTTDDGTWHHAAIRVNTTTLEILIDGAVDATGTENVPTSASDAFTFGHVPHAPQIGGDGVSTSNSLDVIIDEVQVFSKYLDDTVMSQIYNNHSYSTANYPGYALIKKYSAPEPTGMDASGELANQATYNMDMVQPLCNGDVNGVAIASGDGVEPYSYQWDANAGSQTTDSATNVGPGTYYVTITDGNGCTHVDSVTVTEPAPLTSTASANGEVNGCDGDATVTPTGGTTPYSYLWNDGNSQTTQTATGLCGGQYIVTITDANGCTGMDTVFVAYPVGYDELGIKKELAVTPNPNSGAFRLSFKVSKRADAMGVRIVSATGKEVYSNNLGDFKGRYNEEIDLNGIAKGIYFIQIQSGKHVYNQKMVVN